MHVATTSSSPILPEGVVLREAQKSDDGATEALAAAVFGPGRFAKTAYRLRRDNPPVEALCHVCTVDERLVAAITFSRVLIGETRALLLGPLAVEHAWKNRGIGLALMQTGLNKAQASGESLFILVGDAPYYARAGFEPVPRGQMQMPGPVDPARLLAFALVPGALERAIGAVRPALRG
ncbi:MAG: N-acetyltransferase [Pseudomonadota bacterium]